MTDGAGQRLALKGQVLTFRDDPATAGEAALSHWKDGLVLINDGKVDAAGDAAELMPRTGDATVIDYGDHLILPGFIDAHVHYPQFGILASYGRQLMDWLESYTYPEEAKFADPAYAAETAGKFLDALIRNGTTTAAVYCTIHPGSVDAFFEAAGARNMQMISGKMLMDSHAPEGVRESAKTGYDQSKALIGKWHGKGRNLYAITPRFAPTSSPEQLELAAILFKDSDGVYVQSHVSENLEEIALVRERFPKADSYLDVYFQAGLLGPRTLYGHGIHLSNQEIDMAAATETGIVHCPTSNLFMGSGLFQFHRLK